jgi:hypothetical protein
MSVVLAKLVYTYDMELVNPEVDWIGDSKAHLLWKKADLMVRFRVVKSSLQVND